MKALYTIFFFLDVLALVLFTYTFLKLADAGTGEVTLVSLFCAIVGCIVLLVYIMLRFIKFTGSKRHH